LAKRSPARFPVRFLKLWHFQPAQERIGSDSSGLRGFFDVPLCEKRGDRVFLLAAELSAWSLHFAPNSTKRND
jgi:hypothetical protein